MMRYALRMLGLSHDQSKQFMHVVRRSFVAVLTDDVKRFQQGLAARGPAHPPGLHRSHLFLSKLAAVQLGYSAVKESKAGRMAPKALEQVSAEVDELTELVEELPSLVAAEGSAWWLDDVEPLSRCAARSPRDRREIASRLPEVAPSGRADAAAQITRASPSPRSYACASLAPHVRSLTSSYLTLHQPRCGQVVPITGGGLRVSAATTSQDLSIWEGNALKQKPRPPTNFLAVQRLAYKAEPGHTDADTTTTDGIVKLLGAVLRVCESVRDSHDENSKKMLQVRCVVEEAFLELLPPPVYADLEGRGGPWATGSAEQFGELLDLLVKVADQYSSARMSVVVSTDGHTLAVLTHSLIMAAFYHSLRLCPPDGAPHARRLAEMLTRKGMGFPTRPAGCAQDIEQLTRHMALKRPELVVARSRLCAYLAAMRSACAASVFDFAGIGQKWNGNNRDVFCLMLEHDPNCAFITEYFGSLDKFDRTEPPGIGSTALHQVDKKVLAQLEMDCGFLCLDVRASASHLRCLPHRRRGVT